MSGKSCKLDVLFKDLALTILQGVKNASAYNRQKMSSPGYSLVLYQPLSVEEIQPLLAIIPEVKEPLTLNTNTWVFAICLFEHAYSSK